jgi:hypothetical protein
MGSETTPSAISISWEIERIPVKKGRKKPTVSESVSKPVRFWTILQYPTGLLKYFAAAH